MIYTLIFAFVICYGLIIFEHNIKLDKMIPALLAGVILWTLTSIGFGNGSMELMDASGKILTNTGHDHHAVSEVMLHHIGKIAEIMLFLMAVMAIVDLIDLHKGFNIVAGWIKAKKKTHILWISGFIAFFLSAIIDNLTATIILINILRKIIHNREDRLWYASLVILATNAGGAWSPIGDVTTTMLWIAQKISTVELLKLVFLPALISFVLPYFLASFNKVFKGSVAPTDIKPEPLLISSRPMLFIGLAAIVGVPIFKQLTHLPPYLGMILAMCVVWVAAQYYKPKVTNEGDDAKKYAPEMTFTRIELSTIFFLLGILLAVAAFESYVVDGVGSLRYAATALETFIPDTNIVVVILGILSAIIDNVPLVASCIGMYDLALDNPIWHFIAYSAGTGGSILVIGSAAGVAAMGIEKIEFTWYLRKIAPLALIGFLAGCAIFILSN